MTPRISAGILLYRWREHGLEVLLAHPGGPYFARRDAGTWTIPKGEPGPAEAQDRAGLLAVARRELEEETGFPAPDGETIDLGTVVQRGGKAVHAWAIEGDLDPSLAHSNTFELEWPPRSGRRATFPEVDRVAWLDPPAARRLINPAQVVFIDRLGDVLAADE